MTRDTLFRVTSAPLEVRSAATATEDVLIGGMWVPTSTYCHIRSRSEGEFWEMVSPGAMSKTCQPRKDGSYQQKLQYAHGSDSTVASKTIGRISRLWEEADGAYFEARLYPVDFATQFVPAIEAGDLQVSMGFECLKERYHARSTVPEHDGAPAREITELRLIEISLVPHAAYEDTHVGLRDSASLTDEMLVMRFDAMDGDHIGRIARAVDEGIAAGTTAAEREGMHRLTEMGIDRILEIRDRWQRSVTPTVVAPPRKRWPDSPTARNARLMELENPSR